MFAYLCCLFIIYFVFFSKEYVKQLLKVAKDTKKTVIPPPILEELIQSNPEVAEKILKNYAQFNGKTNFHVYLIINLRSNLNHFKRQTNKPISTARREKNT